MMRQQTPTTGMGSLAYASDITRSIDMAAKAGGSLCSINRPVMDRRTAPRC